jgi:serine/threonine protein phosphatase PrpC
MPLLKFHTGAYKAVHPSKAVNGVLPPNADMTAHNPHYLMCLDGVSGVQPPMKPEDYSWDLRNVMQWNLRKRFLVDTDREAYDAKLKASFSPGTPKVAGEFLRNVLALSMSQVKMLGSTTFVAVTVFGSKLTWLKVGDPTILVLRYDTVLSTWVSMLNVGHQHSNCIDRMGLPCIGPTQLSCYQKSENTITNAVAQASKAMFGTLDVKEGDIVMVMSDGPGDCLGMSEIIDKVTEAYDRALSPATLAKDIVNMAITSGLKVDDMSCAVGVVQAKDSKRMRRY